MSALEALTAVGAIILTMIAAIGLHTLQMWLESRDINQH
jgi:hypothetical protein